jgi:hypothetical protein
MRYAQDSHTFSTFVTPAWVQTALATTMSSAKRRCTKGALVAIWILASLAAAVRYAQDRHTYSTLVTTWMQTPFAATMRFAKRSCTLGTLVAIWITASLATAVGYAQYSHTSSALVTATWMQTPFAATMSFA